VVLIDDLVNAVLEHCDGARYSSEQARWLSLNSAEFIHRLMLRYARHGKCVPGWRSVHLRACGEEMVCDAWMRGLSWSMASLPGWQAPPAIFRDHARRGTGVTLVTAHAPGWRQP
jgi:hypothetical protein